jgi:hypothetical protein
MCLGFRVEGFGVWGLDLEVLGFRFRVLGLGCGVSASGT